MAKIGEAILGMIDEAKVVDAPVSMESHLYEDLNFDSLSFIRFLVGIENAFSITIDIAQMEGCLRVSSLIALVEEKVRGRERHD